MKDIRTITVKLTDDGIMLDEELTILKQMRSILMVSFHGYLKMEECYGSADPMTLNAENEFNKYLRFANDVASIIDYEFEADHAKGRITIKKI